MKMNRKPGSVFLTPSGTPKPKPISSPDGIRPQWDFDSQDNYDSWQGVFDEMRRTLHTEYRINREADAAGAVRDDGQKPCKHQQAVQDYKRVGGHRSTAVPPDEPMQAGLTKNGDELVVMTTKKKPIIVPVRKLRNDPRYAVMALPEALWKAYLTYRRQCQTLGFSAVKQGPKWVLLWKPIGG